MKNNDNIKKIRDFLITSVATIVLTNVLTKISELLSVWGAKIGETILACYLNYVCKSAAQANHDMLTMILSIFLIGALCGAAFGFSRLVFKEAKSKSRQEERQDTDASGMEEAETTNDDSYRQTNKNDVKAKCVTIILMVLVACVVLCWFTDYALPIQLLNQFEMDIKAITPYVDAAEIQRLESQWVLMDDCYDYNEIQTYIQSIMETHNLTK